MAELTAGSEFAGHRIEALTGRGGMGVVYRATHLSLDRVVALKVIAPALVEDPAARQRFRRESKLAASIDHPNVIPIYYTGDDDGVAFIAMRFVEGRDLRSLVREHGPLGPARAARIVAQVGAALDAAHVRGLVHRDVKPANVLLGPGDHVYLSDFGLSKHALSLSGETRSGHWVGTLDYVAPEQIRGERPDARSDVYALGAVLYFALTAKAPFPREGDEAKLWAHLTEPPPRATDHLPELSPDFDAVIARAMAKRPDGRYPSAGDLGRAALAAAGLEAPPQGEHAVGVGDAAPEESPTESVSARGAGIARSEAPTVVERHARRRPSRRLFVAGGVGALAIAGAAGVLVGTGGDDPRRRGQSSATPTATATATPSKPMQPSVESVAHVGRRPNSIAVGKGVVLATSFYDKYVTLINEDNGKPLRRKPPIGVGGRDIAVALGGAWVVVSREQALYKLDAASGRQLARISLTHRPQTVTAGHGAVWVGLSSYEPDSALPPPVPDSLVKIDPSANRIETTFPMPAGIRSIVSTPSGIWIVNRDLPTASRVDPASGRITRRVNLAAKEAGDAAYGSGALWIVLPDEDTVVRIDDKTGKKVSIGVGRHPTGIAARGRQVWVTSFIDHTLTRISPRTSRTVGKPVPVRLNPYKLAISGDSVWVTAVGRGEIARVRYRAER